MLHILQLSFRVGGVGCFIGWDFFLGFFFLFVCWVFLMKAVTISGMSETHFCFSSFIINSSSSSNSIIL